MKKTGKLLKFLSSIMMITIILASFNSADLISNAYESKVSYHQSKKWDNLGLSFEDKSEMYELAKRDKEVSYSNLVIDSLTSFGIALLIFGIGEIIVIIGSVDPLTKSEQTLKSEQIDTTL